jgi:Retrotransposon gag protein
MQAEPPNVSQTGSIADYISEFQQATANLSNWGDAALISYFYKGLNDDIKDALVRNEKAKTLQDMMDESARFGKRLEDRRLEKVFDSEL